MKGMILDELAQYKTIQDNNISIFLMGVLTQQAVNLEEKDKKQCTVYSKICNNFPKRFERVMNDCEDVFKKYKYEIDNFSEKFNACIANICSEQVLAKGLGNLPYQEREFIFNIGLNISNSLKQKIKLSVNSKNIQRGK